MSCQTEEKIHTFEFIDYSCHDGWSGFYSIRVENNGGIYILFEDIKNNRIMIKTVLENDILDSLTHLIGNINVPEFDNIDQDNCEDCGYYHFIIKKEKENIDFYTQNIHKNKLELYRINQLSEYLLTIIINNIKLCRTVKFESKTREFSPSVVPPPPNY